MAEILLKMAGRTRIPLKQRAHIAWLYQDGRPLGEIAYEVNRPVSTIGSVIFRLRQAGIPLKRRYPKERADGVASDG